MPGNERTTHAPETPIRVQLIRGLNDILRKTGIGGRILISQGVQALAQPQRSALLRAIQDYDRFDDNIDPYMEHDMGLVTIDGQRFFWKIDYYDEAVAFGSPDPTDPAVTTRILTIMRSDEY